MSKYFRLDSISRSRMYCSHYASVASTFSWRKRAHSPPAILKIQLEAIPGEHVLELRYSDQASHPEAEELSISMLDVSSCVHSIIWPGLYVRFCWAATQSTETCKVEFRSPLPNALASLLPFRNREMAGQGSMILKSCNLNQIDEEPGYWGCN